MTNEEKKWKQEFEKRLGNLYPPFSIHPKLEVSLPLPPETMKKYEQLIAPFNLLSLEDWLLS